MKKILSTLLFCIISANVVVVNAHTKNQRITFMGSGAAIGTLIAGPIGAVIGAALGDRLSDHYDSSANTSFIENNISPFDESGEVSVYFGTGEYKLSLDSIEILKGVAKVIKSNSKLKLYVVAAADPRGKNGYDNKKLSVKRAEEVKNYLVDNENIDEYSILAKGVGPIDAAEKTTENYQKLRVAKLKLINMNSK
ncbi:MAG: OmpA family protein [Endozoicomonadaceae bacterium]|nr:OmpA family protein [Endozoicomonadaceae bacterium]